MRLTAEEKVEIIRLVINSDLSINRSLTNLGIHKRTFYNWYHKYHLYGEDGLKPKRKTSRQWNTIPENVKELVVEIADTHTDLSSREIATKIVDEQGVFISESSVYRILKRLGLTQIPQHTFVFAADKFHTQTEFVNQMWQTDFTYFKIVGWGWYYLSTVIDDYSRYIVHWELCENMKADDVKRTISKAMKTANLKKENAPKLLSDNGSCYIAKDLKEFLLDKHNISQIHGAPAHPQTQGKIERYHKSMKNVIKLQKYYSTEHLNEAIKCWVDYYNNKRYHEALKNLTPADVYYGRGEEILKIRDIIKQKSRTERQNNYYFNKINLDK